MTINKTDHGYWLSMGDGCADDEFAGWDDTCDHCGVTFEPDEMDAVVERDGKYVRATCGACNNRITREEYEAWQAIELAGGEA